MVRDIRLMEMSIGKKEIFIDKVVKEAKEKLERSIAINKNIARGEVISENDIHLLSPGDGVKWINRDLLIGKKVKSNILKNEIIYLNNIEK